jgi:hypothetical protein
MNLGFQSSTDSIRAFISPMLTRANTPPTSPLAKANYDAILQEASGLVKDGPIKSPHLNRMWSEITWNRLDDQRVATDAEVARDGSNRINLYPSLSQKGRKLAAFSVLREFGRLTYSKAPANIQRLWIYKLCLPLNSQIEAVQGKLNPQFKSYREMVESFKTAMDRYVALNLANALIAKGVPYAQSQNVNLKQWGATQEYANRRRYHVLIPLASAYSARDIYEDFGSALADWFCGTNGVTESSVAEAMHEIVRAIVEALR